MKKRWNPPKHNSAEVRPQPQPQAQSVPETSANTDDSIADLIRELTNQPLEPVFGTSSFEISQNSIQAATATAPDPPIAAPQLYIPVAQSSDISNTQITEETITARSPDSLQIPRDLTPEAASTYTAAQATLTPVTTSQAAISENMARSLLDRDSFIAEDEDLRDWLLLTGWHNTDFREKRLRIQRQKAQLEKEMMEMEQAHLASNYGLKAVPTVPPTNTLQSQVGTPTEQKQLITPKTLSNPASPLSSVVQATIVEPTRKRDITDASEAKKPAKRAKVSDADSGNTGVRRPDPADKQVSDLRVRGADLAGKEGRQYSTGQQSPPLSAQTKPDLRYSAVLAPDSTSYGLPTYRQPSPPTEPLRDRTARPDPFYVDAERSYRPEYHRKESSPEPANVDVGWHGQNAAFFLLESYNADNLQECMENGVWITTKEVTRSLARAFEAHKHVILFFTVYRSVCFSGYAVMESLPSSKTSLPSWVSMVVRNLGTPFKLRWLNTAEAPRAQYNWIKNKLQNGGPVSSTRSGEEIQQKAGALLMRELDKKVDVNGFRNRRSRQ